MPEFKAPMDAIEPPWAADGRSFRRCVASAAFSFSAVGIGWPVPRNTGAAGVGVGEGLSSVGRTREGCAVAAPRAARSRRPGGNGRQWSPHGAQKPPPAVIEGTARGTAEGTRKFSRGYSTVLFGVFEGTRSYWARPERRAPSRAAVRTRARAVPCPP